MAVDFEGVDLSSSEGEAAALASFPPGLGCVGDHGPFSAQEKDKWAGAGVLPRLGRLIWLI